MYDLTFYQCLIRSWYRCMKQGLTEEIEKPMINLDSKELNEKLRIKNGFILSFNNLIDKYLDLTKKIKGNYYFALFDNEENLLAVKVGSNVTERYNNDFLVAGISFSERSVGTNAVALSKALRRPIYMLPDFHYCSKLKSWYEYCIPVKKTGNVNGFISVIGISCPISKALEGFVDLIGANMNEELSASEADDLSYNGIKGRLTDKQYLILKMMAQGFTDIHISKELKMSLPTVKFHNQNIFKILNATSRVDAVVKALMHSNLNIFDICYDMSK